MKKTVCPLTTEEFFNNAKPLVVRIGDAPLQADVKDFSTKSFGWYLAGKDFIEVAGKRVQVQIGVTLTVIGSKEMRTTGSREQIAV
jgi:hypothetical protein